jgi:hypothetical protein
MPLAPLEVLDSVAWLVIGTPLLTLTLVGIGKFFSIRIGFWKSFGIIAAMIFVDALLSLLVQVSWFQLWSGILMYTVVAAIAYRFAFDLSWKSAARITFLWFIVQQIVFIVLSTVILLFGFTFVI